MNGRAVGYFRAVAFDYDGTLTEDGGVAPAVFAAIDRARESGLNVVIVTGRILVELREACPTLADHCDLIVAENGAVIAGRMGKRLLAPRVDARLAAAVRVRGVACRRGDVLLACAAGDELIVLEEVRHLGLDCRLVRNRDELLVLPAGVTK